MLELTFPEFWKQVQLLQRAKNQDYRKLLYKEDNEGFTLYIRSRELWEYYCKVTDQDLKEFGMLYSANSNEAKEDFKLTFLYDAVRVKSVSVLSSAQAIQRSNNSPLGSDLEPSSISPPFELSIC